MSGVSGFPTPSQPTGPASGESTPSGAQGSFSVGQSGVSGEQMPGTLGDLASKNKELYGQLVQATIKGIAMQIMSQLRKNQAKMKASMQGD